MLTILLETNTPPLTVRFLPVLIQILGIHSNDPAIINNLALKLLKPVSFTQALALTSEDALVQALESHSPSTNILAIAVIEKAARSPGDTAVLSVMRRAVAAFLRTWLSSPYVEVGERAGKALCDLLGMDCGYGSTEGLCSDMDDLQITARTPTSQALFWRRIFQDGEIYKLLLDLCSYTTVGDDEGQLDERQKSLAQARLLRVLPRMAFLDFPTISRAEFPEIEQQYGMEEGEEGLLWFAAAHMVNKEGDMLMHITLLDFFPELLGMMSLNLGSENSLPYLRRLLKSVAATDKMVVKAFESMAYNPDTPPKLAEMLENILLFLNKEQE